MRAALAAALVLAAAPGGGGGRAAARRRSATSPSRCTSPGRPGDPSRLFVVEKAGRVQLVVDGARAAAPFLDLERERRGRRRRARAALDRLRARLRVERPASTSSTAAHTTGDGYIVIREGRRSRRTRTRGAARPRSLFADPAPGRPTTTAASSRSGPTGALYVSIGDGGANDSGDDAQNPAQPARQDPALRRSRATTAAPTIWALRPAQPVALLVRPRDRRHGDRRRRRGHQRGDRRRAAAPRRQLRLEHAARARTRRRARSPASIAPVLTLPHTRRLLRRDRRLRGPRSRPADARRPLPVRRPVQADAALGRARQRRRRRAPRPTLPVGAPSSFGEDACGHVYVAMARRGPPGRRDARRPRAARRSRPRSAPVAPAAAARRPAGADATAAAPSACSAASLRVRASPEAPRGEAARAGSRARGYRSRGVRLAAGVTAKVAVKARRARSARSAASAASVAQGPRPRVDAAGNITRRTLTIRLRGPPRPLTAKGGGATLLSPHRPSANPSAPSSLRFGPSGPVLIRPPDG